MITAEEANRICSLEYTIHDDTPNNSVIHSIANAIVESIKGQYTSAEFEYEPEYDDWLQETIDEALDYFRSFGYKVELTSYDKRNNYQCYTISWNDVQNMQEL